MPPKKKKQQKIIGADKADRNHAVQEENDKGIGRTIPGC